MHFIQPMVVVNQKKKEPNERERERINNKDTIKTDLELEPEKRAQKKSIERRPETAKEGGVIRLKRDMYPNSLKHQDEEAK